MKNFEYKIEVFDRKVTLNWDFDAKRMIGKLGYLIAKIGGTFIVGYDPTEIFHISEYFYDSDVIRWIEKKFNTENVYSDLATEDVEWTKWRNKDLNGSYYRKYKFHKEVVDAVTEEAKRLQGLLEKELEIYNENKEKERAAAEKEKAELLDGVIWDIKERSISDEGGKTHEFFHHLIIDGKSYSILERNVFDFGKVLNKNPEGGVYGMTKDNEVYIEHLKKEIGWEKSAVVDPGEQRAVRIVFKYGKYAHSSIRM
jgi:hypothetical protein